MSKITKLTDYKEWKEQLKEIENTNRILDWYEDLRQEHIEAKIANVPCKEPMCPYCEIEKEENG